MHAMIGMCSYAPPPGGVRLLSGLPIRGRQAARLRLREYDIAGTTRAWEDATSPVLLDIIQRDTPSALAIENPRSACFPLMGRDVRVNLPSEKSLHRVGPWYPPPTGRYRRHVLAGHDSASTPPPPCPDPAGWHSPCKFTGYLPKRLQGIGAPSRSLVPCSLPQLSRQSSYSRPLS